MQRAEFSVDVPATAGDRAAIERAFHQRFTASLSTASSVPLTAIPDLTESLTTLASQCAAGPIAAATAARFRCWALNVSGNPNPLPGHMPVPIVLYNHGGIVSVGVTIASSTGGGGGAGSGSGVLSARFAYRVAHLPRSLTDADAPHKVESADPSAAADTDMAVDGAADAVAVGTGVPRAYAASAAVDRAVAAADAAAGTPNVVERKDGLERCVRTVEFPLAPRWRYRHELSPTEDAAAAAAGRAMTIAFVGSPLLGDATCLELPCVADCSSGTLAAEPWEYFGPIAEQDSFCATTGALLRIGVQRVRAVGTHHPVATYCNRIYALRRVALCLPPRD
jgi:hypothetical protein